MQMGLLLLLMLLRLGLALFEQPRTVAAVEGVHGEGRRGQHRRQLHLLIWQTAGAVNVDQIAEAAALRRQWSPVHAAGVKYVRRLGQLL